ADYDTDAFVPQYISPSIKDYKAKAFYNTLKDKYKPLYEIIYNGIENTEIKIDIPDREYTSDEVHELYFKVLYDNPQFCYTQNYSVGYWDTNNNEYIDGDEYIAYVMPYYCDVDNSNAEEYMTSVLELCDINGDMMNNLRIVHDRIVMYTDILERYTNSTCTSAQGAIVNGKADDMGFAKAFCYYAQALGLPCYVVDGAIGEELRAWCRVKLDGTWYNVDVYGDKLAGSAVTEAEVYDGNHRSFCTFFLANDEYMERCGYAANSVYDALWSGEYAANAPESNYYLQRDGQNAFYIDPDGAYDFLLEEAAKNYNEGTDKTSCYVMPLEADGLYKRLNGQFLSDLEEKYGITPSEFEIKYYPDEFVIVMS
ncbi:MAG: hypothetical protein K2G87_05045, partial [Oscillospiraceae bacterium]|nr:hypothetical protein [Oscillospiraceae bacterium]